MSKHDHKYFYEDEVWRIHKVSNNKYDLFKTRTWKLLQFVEESEINSDSIAIYIFVPKLDINWLWSLWFKIW